MRREERETEERSLKENSGEHVGEERSSLRGRKKKRITEEMRMTEKREEVIIVGVRRTKEDK